MRDNGGRGRVILAMLLLTAFTLVTLDYRSGGGGPLRRMGNAVFGPIEDAAAGVAGPIGSFFSSLGHLSGYKHDNDKLRKQVQDLRQQLRLTEAERAHLASMEKLLHLDQTVINGDGLVGKTLSVGPNTSTVLLGNDVNFHAGARLEGSDEIGHVDGGGRRPMTFTLLDSQGDIPVGARLVTFGDIANRPFVPEVPIG